MKKAELLAPVGKMENAIAAIENGADALFVGGKAFNARHSADNFTSDELVEIVNYAKLRGVRVYVTVNILIRPGEVEAVYTYLEYLERIGVHAIIIQDLGLARLARQYFPNLRLHASTQMSAHSIEDVKFLQSLGFKRVVLARELQLKEIEAILEACDVEVETFVHGALCYSYSGQCLMSSLIGGRSGNRGRCAQTCRMKYSLKEDGQVIESDSYLLSLKDICSVEFIPQLLEAGIHSFKIEGRMKSPEYVASVVSVYRKYMDLAQSNEPYKVLEADQERLKGIFNRGGFSKGYYQTKGSRQMLTPISPRHMGVKAGEVTRFIAKTGMVTIKLTRDLNPGDGLEIIREGKMSVGTGITKECKAGTSITCAFDKYIEIGSPVYLTKNHQLLKQMRQTYVKPTRRMPVRMEIRGALHEAIYVSMEAAGKRVEVLGGVLEIASNNPLTLEQAKKQLTKLGATSFIAQEVEMSWPDQGYIGVKALNELRREVVQALELALLDNKVQEHLAYVEAPSLEITHETKGHWMVQVQNMAQLEVACNYKEVEGIYWEWAYENTLLECALERSIESGKAFYIALPSIMKEAAYEKLQQQLELFKTLPITGFLIRNMGSLHKVAPLQKECIIDYNLNSMNAEAIRLWKELGASRVSLSVELTKEEVVQFQGEKEQVVYGYLPVMTSSQCVLRGTSSCQKGIKNKHTFELEDRKNVAWRIETDCESCKMQIMSHDPISIRKSDRQTEGYLRIQLTQESIEQTKEVLDYYLGIGESHAIKGVVFKELL